MRVVVNEIPFCTQLTLIKAASQLKSIGDEVGCSNIIDLLNTISGFNDSFDDWVNWAEREINSLTTYNITID